MEIKAQQDINLLLEVGIHMNASLLKVQLSDMLMNQQII
jgi:hypothetical protein